MHLHTYAPGVPTVAVADSMYLNRQVWLDISEPLALLRNRCENAGLDPMTVVVVDQLDCGEVMIDEDATLDELHRFAQQLCSRP